MSTSMRRVITENRFIKIAAVSAFFLIVLIILVLNINPDKPPCKNCNIILVSIDTFGSNHLPCYGYERNTAPNLCSFAKRNVMFSNSYSNAPWTLPSHFSIFTSLYPRHHGILDEGKSLNNKIFTLPEVLRRNGYKTVWSGITSDLQLPLKKGMGRGFTNIISADPLKQDIRHWDKALKMLADNNKKGDKTFLFLHTYWVHSPYIVGDMTASNKRMYTSLNATRVPLIIEDFVNNDSDDFLNSISKMDELLTYDVIDRLLRASMSEKKNIFNGLSSTEKYNIRYKYYFDKLKEVDKTGGYARALYDEAIFHLDGKITRLLDTVEKSKLSENTILIITSDHGEQFMEHGTLGHPVDQLYNSVTSTPLIMYIPGVKQKKISDLVESVDIFPTVLTLVGIRPFDNIDGVDLTGLIFNQPEYKGHEFIISNGYNIDSIRTMNTKLYEKDGQTDTHKEMYDLINDPLERENIASREGGMVDDLSKELSKIIYGSSN